MKKIIVTGATSFIGYPLVQKLLDNGYFVYAIVRPNSESNRKIKPCSNLKIIECEMAKYDQLEKLIRDKCDAFYHIAWNGTRVPERDNEEIQEANYKSSLIAFNTAVALKCKAFFSTGSQAEYGDCIGEIDENYNPIPKTEYGKAKLKSFKTIKELAVKEKIKFGWIRIFSAYGENDYKNSLVSSCIKKMKLNENIEMTSGLQKWNYIYIGDVINILYTLLINDNYVSEVFNVCSNDTRMLKEYVIELKNILHSNSNLLFGVKKYNDSEGVVSFNPLNNKVAKILGITKYTSFRDGIIKTISFGE